MTVLTEQGAKLPAHEVAYQRLREMVLFGELTPGEAVTIQGLVERSRSGMTPVREAIRRLTAEGALMSTGNRRVAVPQLDEDQLGEIIFARQSVEPELTRRATHHISDDGILNLVAIDQRLEEAIAAGDVRGYLRHNYTFHRTIYAYANAPILAAIAEALWLRAGPSLRVVCGRFGTANLPDLHEEAINALRARDAQAASHAIREDIAQGHSQILRSFASS